MNKREYLKESLKEINEFLDPATLALTGAGLAGLGVLNRINRRQILKQNAASALRSRYPGMSKREVKKLIKKATKMKIGRKELLTAKKGLGGGRLAGMAASKIPLMKKLRSKLG